MTWKIAIAMLATLALSSPAFATDMTHYTGHHACASGGKKGGCMEHHYMGHQACPSGGKKGGCMTHHYTGHHVTSSGDKKNGMMH